MLQYNIKLIKSWDEKILLFNEIVYLNIVQWQNNKYLKARVS